MSPTVFMIFDPFFVVLSKMIQYNHLNSAVFILKLKIFMAIHTVTAFSSLILLIFLKFQGNLGTIPIPPGY